MSREAIEVGAFRSCIQRLYEPDATAHWQRCEAEGRLRTCAHKCHD
jgi:hypothetical protein